MKNYTEVESPGLKASENLAPFSFRCTSPLSEQTGNCRYGDRCRYSHGQDLSPEMSESGSGVSNASNAAGWAKAGFGGGGGNFGTSEGFSSRNNDFGSSQTVASRGGSNIRGLDGGVGFGSSKGFGNAGGFGGGESVVFGPGFSAIGGKSSTGKNGGFGVGGFPRLGATTSGGGFALAGTRRSWLLKREHLTHDGVFES